MSSKSETTVILEPKAAFSAAGALTVELQDNRKTSVSVDAANVTHIGAPCLQVLLSAVKTWKKDGSDFQIINPSDAFLKGIDLMGVSLQDFGGNGDNNAN